MTRPAGWHIEYEPRPRRFLWLSRPEPHPAHPLRISAPCSDPTDVQVYTTVIPDPVEVAWLFRRTLVQTQGTTNFNLEPRASHSQAPAPADTTTAGQVERSHQHLQAARPEAVSSSSLAKRLRSALNVPLDVLLPSATSILEWPAALKPYQLEGVRLLLEQERVLLADDMGLGKTIQAVAAIRIMCIRRAIERTLLIVPASLLDQWRREITRWAPELRTIIIRGSATDRAWQWSAASHVTIVSYESFRVDFTRATRRRSWDLVVLDEAQKIKNRETEISHRVKQIPRARSWAMTGTPLENELGDLASILEFVDHNEGGTSKRYAPSQALLRRHRELQLRRRKFDVLEDLPPKQVISIRLSLLPRQLEAYRRAENEGIIQLRKRGPAVRIEHVLALITRLKQICNVDPVSGESAKLEDIRERLQVLTAEQHRALIFSQYTDDTFGVGAVARFLAEFHPLTYIGAMVNSEREATIRNFKADESHRALILSLKAGGVGLNLQEASYVFHLDRWWNPAVERQAEDRSHRMGQVVPVTVLKYTCLETIEERIDRILVQKQQLFDEFVDDVSLDVSRQLTRGELFGLFNLDPPSYPHRPAATARPGHELEVRCAAILKARGWNVQRTPLPQERAIDVIATKTDEVGLEQTAYLRCNDHPRPVGVDVVRALLGVLPSEGKVWPIIVASAGLTEDAQALAGSRDVAIWDDATLERLEHP